MSLKYLALVPACIAVSGGKAEAQEIKVGVTHDFIGATSAVGGPYMLAAELYPDHLGGVPVKWIGLDDVGNTSTAVKNTRKFIDEDKGADV